MSKSLWYEESELKDTIEQAIIETLLYKKDFEKAKNPAKAQLWTAIALLNKKIEELKDRLIKLEQNIKGRKEKRKNKNKKLNKSKKI